MFKLGNNNLKLPLLFLNGTWDSTVGTLKFSYWNGTNILYLETQLLTALAEYNVTFNSGVYQLVVTENGYAFFDQSLDLTTTTGAYENYTANIVGTTVAIEFGVENEGANWNPEFIEIKNFSYADN